MHANFEAVEESKVYLVSTYRPITHIKLLLWQAAAKNFSHIFADLTPDGFHFWMTLSPRTSEPVRHAPVPPPGAKFWRRYWDDVLRL